MPSLTPEDRERMLGPRDRPCPKCGQTPVRNYCRQCDEFFTVCGCPLDPPDEPYGNNHTGHRTY